MAGSTESMTEGGVQTGVKSPVTTKMINISPHAHGSSSHPEMGGQNPKQGRITDSK